MRFLRSPAGVCGLALVLAVVVLAVIGPPLWGDEAARFDGKAILKGSSDGHLLGTDNGGRDIFARVLVAARLSVGLAALATLLGVVIGVPLGALAAILPARGARMVSGAVSALVAFPGLLLAMFTSTVAGLGGRGAVLGVGIATAPALARLTQTLAAGVIRSDYVAAARILGVPRWKITTRHVLPNIAEPLIITVTATLGFSLLGLATLSFLGMGVQPDAYDWGRLLREGLGRINVDPETALGPAAAIALAGIGFSLLGEGLARATNPGSARARPRRLDGVTTSPETPDQALDVHGLTVAFPGDSTPVRDLSLSVAPGEIVGIVGESGSGKSLTALAIAGLVPYPGTVQAGTLTLDGTDLTEPGAHARLGTRLAMVFQDPMAALNPALRVGGQLAEVAAVHQGADRRTAWDRAVERLRQVHIPDPAVRARRHPHEFSGGMRQRAVIAMGLMGTPQLIIADEPTTALDVTVQRQVLTLLREVSDETGAAIVLISHDIAVVSQLCHRVVVMYAGRVAEELPVAALSSGPAHPYTRALLAALPDMATDRELPLATIEGRPPNPADEPPGCPFAPRCAYATGTCHTDRPPLTDTGSGSRLACWHPQSGPVTNLHITAVGE